MQTLLEKAKQIKNIRKKIVGSNEEELELFLAFLNGDISINQTIGPLSFKNVSQLYPRVVRRLKVEIELGNLQLKRIEKHERE